MAKSVNIDVPSFILFILGTDSKYDHSDIELRFNIISRELRERGITVISNGADGAGPFLRCMVNESKLFSTSKFGNVPVSWSFFLMPKLDGQDLSIQDHVHLLAKFRTRFLNPSNLLILGIESASSVHLLHVVNNFPKARHNLSLKAIDSKDKQNYSSITVMLTEDVQACLGELSAKMKTRGTVMYLKIMRSYRDAIFDKSIAPLKRIKMVWYAVFFCRVWRSWLRSNGYPEDDHFLTPNVYTCLELNAHTLVCIVYGCMNGLLPVASLRVWLSGSQGCEQVFRLLRSMTGTFSTIINFSMKGVIGRINKLNFVSSAESSDNIMFPRVQRRLLQLNDETSETFTLPEDMASIEQCILTAKREAIEDATACQMSLESYEDECMVRNIEVISEAAMAGMREDLDRGDEIIGSDESTDGLTQEEISEAQAVVVDVQEDLAPLRKQTTQGLPVYDKSSNPSVRSKSFNPRHFVPYNGQYIRKSTALYLLQENIGLSNDRLLRVREEIPDHLYSGSTSGTETSKHVITGDLCFFRRIDCEKVLVGRVVQFSYIEGNKKERQYTSSYVDMEKDSHKKIGVFSNWYAMTANSFEQSESSKTFCDVNKAFKAGYLPMSYYVSTITGDLQDICESSFTISSDKLTSLLPNWNEIMTVETEFLHV